MGRHGDGNGEIKLISPVQASMIYRKTYAAPYWYDFLYSNTLAT